MCFQRFFYIIGKQCVGVGVPYQHTGTAQVISAVKIRVIDPVTGEAVVGLGANSTVFLEIIKAEKVKK